jgi:hypothetical protein
VLRLALGDIGVMSVHVACHDNVMFGTGVLSQSMLLVMEPSAGYFVLLFRGISCSWLCAVNPHVVCLETGQRLLTANLSLCGACRDSQQLTLYMNWLCKHDAHHASP